MLVHKKERRKWNCNKAYCGKKLSKSQVEKRAISYRWSNVTCTKCNAHKPDWTRGKVREK